MVYRLSCPVAHSPTHTHTSSSCIRTTKRKASANAISLLACRQWGRWWLITAAASVGHCRRAYTPNVCFSCAYLRIAVAITHFHKGKKRESIFRWQTNTNRVEQIASKLLRGGEVGRRNKNTATIITKLIIKKDQVQRIFSEKILHIINQPTNRAPSIVGIANKVRLTLFTLFFFFGLFLIRSHV